MGRRDHPSPPPFEIATDHVVAEVRADPTRPGGRLLVIDGVESSYIDLADPTHLEFEYLRHLARLVDLAHPRKLPTSVFQVGGGPCAFARYLAATRRNAQVTVVERDGGLIDLAREWLGLETGPRLEVRVGEGRAELATIADASLDVLVIDAFDGVVAPHHLLTREFLDEASRVLRPGGLHVVNLIDIPPLGLASAAAATLADRYASTALVADAAVLEHRSSGNVVIAGSDTDLPTDRLARLVALDRAPWEVLAGRALRRFTGHAPLLRDDVKPDHALAVLAPLWGRGRREDPPYTRPAPAPPP